MAESSENVHDFVKTNRNFENLCKGLQNSRDSFWELCRSRKMLKNAPTLAIGGVHTAKNEPQKDHKSQEKPLRI